jgi:hypothetical protein
MCVRPSVRAPMCACACMYTCMRVCILRMHLFMCAWDEAPAIPIMMRGYVCIFVHMAAHMAVHKAVHKAVNNCYIHILKRTEASEYEAGDTIETWGLWLTLQAYLHKCSYILIWSSIHLFIYSRVHFAACRPPQGPTGTETHRLCLSDVVTNNRNLRWTCKLLALIRLPVY